MLFCQIPAHSVQASLLLMVMLCIFGFSICLESMKQFSSEHIPMYNGWSICYVQQVCLHVLTCPFQSGLCYTLCQDHATSPRTDFNACVLSVLFRAGLYTST